ncbi:unnamed protein product (mitochondrion) [Plasmodiophora brassicae]|uniref:MYND-type domain-containing protein n=1 Tax=Plasmodiophora brassicae TaxID=37360 RepID=A0A0G4J038_PLABS|nr:hypothetical protein PBRA_008189 [Plasmodiophora brassicae]SPR01185.1 unnamed protein product [Plasmodiophora brassicae]
MARFAWSLLMVLAALCLVQDVFGVHCSVCGESMEKKLRCGRCQAISYCSVKCQRADWPHHRQTCKTGAERKEADSIIKRTSKERPSAHKSNDPLALLSGLFGAADIDPSRPRASHDQDLIIRQPTRNYTISEIYEAIRRAAPSREELIAYQGSYYSSPLPNRRNAFVATFGWCIPDERAVAEIARFIGPDRRALSVGSGRALVEFLLKSAGVNIIATDNFERRFRATTDRPPYMPVYNLEAVNAVETFHPDVLVLIWPPFVSKYDEDAGRQYHMAGRALKAFQGDHLVYIGEEEGGCTADPEFFHELNDKWTSVEDVPIRTWYPFVHDWVQLYARNRPGPSRAA